MISIDIYAYIPIEIIDICSFIHKYIHTGSWGDGPDPRSQLGSCVDECEQTFLAISESTPQFSAPREHMASAAAICRRATEKRGKPPDGDLSANASES